MQVLEPVEMKQISATNLDLKSDSCPTFPISQKKFQKMEKMGEEGEKKKKKEGKRVSKIRGGFVVHVCFGEFVHWFLREKRGNGEREREAVKTRWSG